MGAFVALVIIALTVVVDFFWLDTKRKRWAWMENWTKALKGLFFSGFILVSILIYVGLSLEYL
ncbi:hypothetical protein H0266_08470 [Halobacillus locisalis]|uniref:Immunity protein 17 n=1 Tax=Halobacillus locisalis TaxID=220753 RepID=A0A838CST2_9BACI|nr:hypothetical protein [Halobacillus locisalis]MBA2174923.1 hypothetical protein [Halobacillus locisalis]